MRSRATASPCCERLRHAAAARGSDSRSCSADVSTTRIDRPSSTRRSKSWASSRCSSLFRAAVNGSCHCQTVRAHASAPSPATISSVPTMRASRFINPPSRRVRRRAGEAAGRAAPVSVRRVGRVPAHGQRSQLRGDGEPREAERDDDPRDVADRHEREEIPRRLEPEPEPRREGQQQQQRAGKAEYEQRSSSELARGLGLGQPQPGVQRGQEVDERERVRRDDEQRNQTQTEQRNRVPGEDLLGAGGPARNQTLTRNEPAHEQERAEDAEHHG